MVRYMDDFIFWHASRNDVTVTDQECRKFLTESLRLTAQPLDRVNRSSFGVTFVGFRMFAGTIRLAASRRRRFLFVKRKWECEWLAGRIDAMQLQRGYDAAHAITLHADAEKWRRWLAIDSPIWHDEV